jgi:hypothetical protein
VGADREKRKGPGVTWPSRSHKERKEESERLRSASIIPTRPAWRCSPGHTSAIPRAPPNHGAQRRIIALDGAHGDDPALTLVPRLRIGISSRDGCRCSSIGRLRVPGGCDDVTIGCLTSPSLSLSPFPYSLASARAITDVCLAAGAGVSSQRAPGGGVSLGSPTGGRWAWGLARVSAVAQGRQSPF